MTPTSSDRTLYRGGSVYSPADPFATAVLVEGGVVAWVGSDEAAASMARVGAPGGGGVVVVDLDGALVTPAFVDAHVHVTETGLALDGLDLSAVGGAAELLDALAAEHRRRTIGEPGPARATILGHGWDDTGWSTSPPTPEQIARAAPGAEVYLSRVDVHSALVSPALAARVGLPPVSGPVTGEAHHAVRDATRALTPEQRRRAQDRALRAAAAAGIACVHENAAPHVGSGEDVRALLDLVGVGAEEGSGPRPDGDRPAGYPQVVALWGQAAGDAEHARALIAALGLSTDQAGALLGLGGDLVVDGSLGSRTAALLAPYDDGTPSPAPYLDAPAIAAHLLACTRAGVQGGFHVIGDAAVAELVSGLRLAEADVGRPALASSRHRVEHAEMLGAADVAVLAALGVTASVQPAFDAAWGGPEGMYERRLGAGRARSMNDLAALVGAGVPLALGSDSPVTPFAPWEAVRASTFPHARAHATTARAAFLAHTRGGWRAAGRDGVGSVVPGAPAHLAVWEAGDLLVQTPDDRVAGWSTDVRSGTPGLPDLTPGVPAPRCLRTVVAGAVVHDDL